MIGDEVRALANASGEQTRKAINSAKTKVTAVSENTEKASAGLQAAADAARHLQDDAASTQSEISHFLIPQNQDWKNAA
ncbi:MAG: hypothetical protein AB8B63_14340 [Granulosicoccus sp.]